MQVRVYYNLHKETFSIQHKVDGRWLVRGYADEVLLKDATFKVSEAGRERVLMEGRKNVHAYVIGTLVEEVPPTVYDITYNPYKFSSFVEKKSALPVCSARYARLKDRQIEAAGIEFAVDAYDTWWSSLDLEDSQWDQRSDNAEERAKYQAYEGYLDNACALDSFESWSHRLTGQQLMAQAVDHAESEWEAYL